MKNIIKLLALGLSITFILSGCGSSSSDDNTDDKLTVESVELK
jgi:uncharacterized protein YceK